ncbi:MAG: hypothetical protein KKG09_04435 [Verrucomicrobia bacterium]|nr:hypothetical protein [Verrucomicrobiota bacterium]MCG2680861.1 hypothetical protein [Kiritimatiellia bacterium]MBU4246871.1 hypothetical protein [Verrucomicrobiota bacterium]MBU4290383.1 hypothetical protein [Verrucomicrobiota bacterium]MBU4430234.1 hypothetical protein [Verrucomicrobiota bacterium]
MKKTSFGIVGSFAVVLALGALGAGISSPRCLAGQAADRTVSIGKDDAVWICSFPPLAKELGNAAASIRIALTEDGKPLAGKEIIAGITQYEGGIRLAVMRKAMPGNASLLLSDVVKKTVDAKGCLNYQAKPESLKELLKGQSPDTNPMAQLQLFVVVPGGKSLKGGKCSVQLLKSGRPWKDAQCTLLEEFHKFNQKPGVPGQCPAGGAANHPREDNSGRQLVVRHGG